MPIVLLVAYYAAHADATFDPALNMLTTGERGHARPTWLVRIGGASQTNHAGVYTSSFFGLIPQSDEAQRRRDLVSRAQLVDNCTATYLAKFDDRALPIVLTAYRTTKTNGQLSYDLEPNGATPILWYVILIASTSAVGTALFEISRLFRRRNQRDCLSTRSPTAN